MRTFFWDGKVWVTFSFKRTSAIFLFLILPFFQSIAQNSQPETFSEKSEKIHSNHNNVYLGAKLGLVFVFGLELEYIFQTKNINRFYLAAAVQSSVIINSANAGGGFFLGRSGIGVGCRYHHLLWFENEKESTIQPGFGPEVVYNKTIGTKYIINLHAGGIVTEGSFFPDISFGVFLPLNK